MKNFKSILTFFFLVLGLTIFTSSCKKDTPAPLKTIDGKFVGYSKLTNDPTEYYLNFVFSADGTLTRSDDPNLVGDYLGSWVLNGNTVTGEFYFAANPNTKFSFTGTFDAKTGIINGTWGLKPNVTGVSTFTVTKQ
jgi:hypothetical protein